MGEARRHKLPPQLLMNRTDGLMIWLVQHDREEHWLSCWYRMNCTRDDPDSGVQFDVREVPGYTGFPSFKGGMSALRAHLAAERRHCAEVIAKAIDDGWMPVVGVGGTHRTLHGREI